MGERTVREVLNRLRWHPEEGGAQAVIGFLERGEDGERVEETTLAAVLEILPGGVSLSGGTFIPYHRLRFVRQGGVLLWRARERKDGDEG